MYKMTAEQQRHFVLGMKDCQRGRLPILGATDFYLMGYAYKIGGLR